jgi:prepilin-type processing-associated H-X9-DG protein
MIRQRSFRLIELLVVILVFFVLGVMSLSGLSYSREAARRTRCLNNLRQIIIACTAYSDKDPTNGFLPYHKRGPQESLYLLLKTKELTDDNIFDCPAIKYNLFRLGLYRFKYRAKPNHPIINNHLETIKHPDYLYYWKDGPISNRISSNLAIVSDKNGNHNDPGGNVVFLDGHGRYIRDKNVAKAVLDGPYYDTGDSLTKDSI